MADYIDKQATIGAIHSAIYSYFCGAEDGDELSEDEKLVLSVNKAICTAIKAFPSADVQPVRHGHWIIKDNPGTGWYRVTCSECGEDVTSVVPVIGFFPNAKVIWDYCPECGARMDGEQNG